MTFASLSRAQLEDELRRCNEQMLKDGDKIADMKALLIRLRGDFADYLRHADPADVDSDAAHYADRIHRIDCILSRQLTTVTFPKPLAIVNP